MKIRAIFLSLFCVTYVFASAPDGSLVNNIELAKSSYMILQVTDAQKQIRQFLLSCEMNIPESRLEQLTIAGVSHVALNAGEFQSLINYWLTPATDNFVVCTDKKTTKRMPLPKAKGQKTKN